MTHGIHTLAQHQSGNDQDAPPLDKERRLRNRYKTCWIEASSNPQQAHGLHQLVLVSKKDGSKRFCVDYRALNKHTVKDSFPLPRIDESLDYLAGAKYFCTLDLAAGYWQVPLDEDAKSKSAFVVPGGLFQFEVMPFGLCNAPVNF